MEIEIDIIQEVMNIGIGEAAFALSELIHSPVLLRVPEIRIIRVADIPISLNREMQAPGILIAQDFNGLIEGKVLLSYPYECSLSLINVLFGDSKTIGSLSSTDIATLQEIGNILIVSCLSTISNMIEGRLNFTLPRVTIGSSGYSVENLVKELTKFEQCIWVKNEMSVKDYDIQGYIFILLSFKDLQVIVAKLNERL